ncbi:type VI secretion system tip protein VgrG [bacterium]|nr:type VI secretion system tip protein VgrG [bacterium]
MNYTQDNIYLSVATPLGKDKLLLRSVHGEEMISGPFHFTLEMVSEEKNLSFDSVVGKSATVTIAHSNGEKRYINGMIGRFYQGGTDGLFTTYYAELHPWLWLLTLTTNSQIFQEQTAPEIIKAVFSDLGFTDFKDSLTKTYDKRVYCVQYHETAFNFVSRLMEDEGIFYFFEHDDGKHTLVLADDTDAHQPCPGLSGAMRYRTMLEGETEGGAITQCTYEQQVVTGKYAVDDFNFETPSQDLMSEVPGDDGTSRIYEYPSGIDKKNDGHKKAKSRLESHEWFKRLLQGQGTSPTFTSGYKFDLVGHDRTGANTTYVLRRVSHTVSVESYVNSFNAFPATVPFRPQLQTPKPVIPGAQTAIVVGKSGEEIWTDKYGRIKVQFHWDQKGKNDENSSCWIRVMQGWAGKNWGSIFVPRIGQEVVVSFLNGDPDRPLITGGVYNAEQTVPYALPGEQTKSTIKSNSSKGGGGFNEIRLEDKKDSEEFFVHAQKDMQITILNDRTKDVQNNETNTIKQNRTTTIQEANESLTVEKGDRTIKVNTGNETHEVKGKRELTVTGNETHTNKANFTQDVSGNHTLKVKGNLTIDVTGSITIKAGQDIKTQAGMNINSKAGMNMNHEGGVAVNSKGGASHKVESGGIVTVQGSLVKVN